MHLIDVLRDEPLKKFSVEKKTGVRAATGKRLYIKGLSAMSSDQSRDEVLRTLCQRIRQGDEACWDEVHQYLRPSMELTARRRGLRKDEVDDVVQEAWLSIVRERLLLGQVRNYTRYINAVVGKKAIDRIRKNESRRRLGDDTPYTNDIAAPQRLVDAETMDSINDFFRRLTPDLREIAKLKWFDELTYDAIATGTGRPPRTIERLVQVIYAIMKQYRDENEGEQ